MYGKGIHSIRWRFTLASAVLTTVGVMTRDAWLGIGSGARATDLAGIAVLVVAIASATYWMASRLTSLIAALDRSTRAIAAGDFDRAVEIDCQCEVGGLAESFRTMTRRLNANVLRMNALAYTDAITGLPNRAVITQLLEFALSPERGPHFRAAILFIDLDGFKRINDTLGHRAGDELLKAASLRLLERGLLRTPDTLDNCMDAFGNPCQRLPEDIVFARFAGDEFVAIVPGLTDRTALAALGERLVASLDEPFVIAGRAVTVGASIGIAVTPDDTRSATELLSFADLAMYSSKQAGKARFRFFDRKVRAMMVESSEIEADLRHALDRDELVLHFQPKVDACTLSMEGVEALVRWHHPQRGLLPPGAFIDIAERTGLMTALGARVVVLAARQARAWLERGIERPIAINVSPSQFVDPGFVHDVLGTLDAFDVPPRLITLEITESIAMTDFECTVTRLAELRAAGVRIALDDFGIGFSNLSMLSHVPLDKIKIDRSLVSDIGANPKSEAIIQAILGISRGLGLTTVAEGIETEAQLDWLRRADCDTLQGFLFARPMRADDLDAWAERRPDAPAHPPVGERAPHAGPSRRSEQLAGMAAHR